MIRVLADGAEVISDFQMMDDQDELFGLVASVPTAWRALSEIAWGGERPGTCHRGGERRPAACGGRASIPRHSGLPGMRIADKVLDGMTYIRLEAPSPRALTCACHRFLNRNRIVRRGPR
jgi:hypothetical protein